ncbi:hypothetical protein VNO77_08713 [Canavalia gladiata]|uniref:Uncharacterized protein n=1 Tax=Canavalia gladiata TaxID=3824 RepID=A0AAN9MFB6_CANGL
MFGKVTATKYIIIHVGFVSFVPESTKIDEETLITSDHALKLESVLDWMAMLGNGYIDLETSQGTSDNRDMEGFVNITGFETFSPSHKSFDTGSSVVYLDGMDFIYQYQGLLDVH